MKQNTQKDDKKAESVPQQHALITHEVDLKQSLDEKISQKLEQEEREEQS